MNRLLIATTNSAKLAEYRLLLQEFRLEVLSLRDVGIDAEAPEDAATFAANARLKAEFYFDRAGIATLADDGGLEVDAMDGAPGVHSHRWLGADADDRTLAEEIIRRMDGVEPARRTATLSEDDDAAQAVAAYLGALGRASTMWPFPSDAPAATIRQYLHEIAVFLLTPNG